MNRIAADGSRKSSPPLTVTGWLLVVAGFIGALPVWMALFGQVLDAHEVDTECAAGAPSGAAKLGEEFLFDIERTFFPAGRQCIYDMQDGSVLAIQTGWTSTIWALGGTALCVLATVIAWVVWRRISGMQRLWVHIALLFVTVGWAAIARFAALG